MPVSDVGVSLLLQLLLVLLFLAWVTCESAITWLLRAPLEVKVTFFMNIHDNTDLQLLAQGAFASPQRFIS